MDISIDDLNLLFGESFSKIIPTKDGISDSTYILEKNSSKYILKIFQKATIEEINSEKMLLSMLKNLPTPQLISEVLTYKNKNIAIYSFLNGNSPKKVNIINIKNIALTLGKIHKKTRKKILYNKNIYTKDKVLQLTKENNCNIISKRYKFIKNIKLKNHGIIHGDLFLDNSKFLNNSLSGIFDFIEACNGDFRFDLSVVANSWCFHRNKLNKKYLKTLISSYNKYSPIKIKHIKDFMLFAAFFYSSTRYYAKYIEKRQANVKNYMEYIKKFDEINKKIKGKNE